MAEEDKVKLKFRLNDGSDIGPFRYSPRTTVSELKEKIVSVWPKDKKIAPKEAGDMRLIGFGKFLENSSTVGQCTMRFGELSKGVITMHVIVQPSSIVKAKTVEAAKKPTPNPQITVMGMVYCDICSNNSFSRHSYFLPGVEVRIDCMFKAIAPRTSEQISFSVNRTTNKHGIYKLKVPYVDGVQCGRDDKNAIGNSCRASLISSPSSSCNVPGFRTTSDEISVKSRSANFCMYSLNALSYRPSKRATALCGK